MGRRDDDGTLILELPEPPVVSQKRGHWAKRHRLVRDAKAAAWTAAVQQERPYAEPPRRVRVHAYFRLWAPRDWDNLVASLKVTLDALKQNAPPNDRLGWRAGICVARGYFWDDDPAHLTLGKVTQVVDRKDRGLTLGIETLDGEE